MTEWGPLDKDKLKIEVAADDPAIAHGVEDNRPITGFVWLTTGLEAFAAPLHADQEKVIQALKKLEQEDEGEDEPTASPRWIPVTEHLPEENKPVLVTHRGKYQAFVSVDWIDPHTHEWNRTCNVTAWMPLPEPWKGEDDATD